MRDVKLGSNSPDGNGPDIEQGVVRVTIGTAVLAYLLLAGAFHEGDSFSAGGDFWFLIGFYTFAWLAFLAALRQSKPSTVRRVLAIFVDLGCTTYGLAVTGAVGAPLAILALWVPMGNGYRYGAKYLLVAMCLGVLGLGIVGLVSPYWQENSHFLGGLIVVALFMPLYVYALLRRESAARRAAESANAQKAEALKRISHELLTPAASVVSILRLAERAPSLEAYRRFGRSVLAAGEHLTSLARELVTIAEIENKELEPDSIVFCPADCVRSIGALLTAQASEKGIGLATLVDAKSFRLVRGDERRLRQVLLNLASNALKFSTRGRVVVHCYSIQQTSGCEYFGFEVSDEGPGISYDQQARIFDAFYQVGGSADANSAGLGLGTTISKELVTLLGGELALVSEPGRGASFSFSLPFTVTPETKQKIRTQPVAIVGAGDATPSEIAAVSRYFCIVDSAGDATWRAESEGRFVELAISRSDNDEAIGDADVSGKVGSEGEAEMRILVLPGQQRKLAVGEQRELSQRGFDVYPHFDDLSILADGVVRQFGSENDSPNAAPDLSVVRVLVVDDDSIAQLFMEHVFSPEQYELTIESTGRGALAKLRDGDVDIAFMDLNLPDLNADRVLEMLGWSNSGETRSPPVIILSAAHDEATKRMCLTAGASEFIEKPPTPDSIYRLVEKFAASR